MVEIAIIGRPAEPEVDRLVTCLAQLGYPTLIVDTAVFPQLVHLTFVDGFWQYQKNNLNDVKVFFLRSLHCSELMEKIEASGQTNHVGIMALREKDSMLGSLLRWLVGQNRAILNPLESLLCHYYKLDTIERLQQAGVPVPATMATNDPEAVQKFVKNHTDIVCKPLAGGAIAIGMSAGDISEQFYALLRIAPAMLQARIYGYDVRAYVLNNQVISAASTLTEHVDFRTDNQRFQPTALTQDEAQGVIQAARLMSLSFAAIDFKRTSDGHYFILDVNPAPLFTGFEQITGLEVAGPIAKHLVAICSSGHLPS